ncbi:restriction endonuclease subunit S [Glaesserella parasuis]|nr:restriction endonuclease subunit S [Glaesserella parasuis]
MSKLGDFVRVQGGYAFKSSELSDDKTGVPVIKIGNITGGSFVDLSNYQSVSFQLFEKTKSFATKDNDILIAMTGANVGKTSRVPVNSDAYLINQRVGRFLLKEDCPYTSDFIYYVVSSKQAYQYFSRVADGAAQPNISGKTIEDLEFPNIDSRCANKIGNILKSLDDKIQLNTQINQTLEQIAQTIFKSWFIDFDPVHAKANALASGQTAEQATQAAMSVISGKNTQELHRLQTANPEQYQQLWEIAEAFPSGFDEEGVPRGWIRGNIGAITKAKRLKVGCVDAIVLSAVSSSELIRSDELFTKQVYSKSIEKYLQVHLWDFAYNPSRINIGSIGLLKENIIGAVSPVYEVFSVKEKYHWFLEKILSLEYTKKYIQTLASGSVRQSLKLSELQTIPCVIPNEFIMDLFNSYYISFLDYITNNEKQNTTLSNIRDELLPKLLSGEV